LVEEMLLAKLTPGVVQAKPILTPGVLKVALLEATTYIQRKN
jgi:hypothetical protein